MSNCSCAQNRQFCERYCACAQNCSNRFQGCACDGNTCKTNSCACYAQHRECHPDLCTGCDAAHQYGGKHKTRAALYASNAQLASNSTAKARGCANMRIQTLQRKNMLLGRSLIHGLGAFSNAHVRKNELITEYVGEIISQDEADRRGRIYDKYDLSYLFNLNDQFVIDAERKGTKVKFANHSAEPNCYSRVMLVNGDHRIGIYANASIRPGDELFFDYKHDALGCEPMWWNNKDEKSNCIIGTGAPVISPEDAAAATAAEAVVVADELKAAKAAKAAKAKQAAKLAAAERSLRTRTKQKLQQEFLSSR
jgi:histone-lysine N-methyltransferase EZH2